MIEETLRPDAVVPEIARRHGLTPQQVFTWRREARRRAQADGAGSFVPAAIDARGDRASVGRWGGAMIELDIGGDRRGSGATRTRAL